MPGLSLRWRRAWARARLAVAGMVFIAASGGAASVQAQPPGPPSVLFTEREIEAIRAARESITGEVENIFAEPEETPEEEPTPVRSGPDRLYLGAILYFGEQRWTFWLNGEEITPGDLPDQVEQVNVFPDEIFLSWIDRPRDQIVTVTLRPREGYDLAGGRYLRDLDGLPLGDLGLP